MPDTPKQNRHAVDIRRIIDMLPHRYPFLLIDRVLDYSPRESIHAIKNVTVNEPFFQGHFPGMPVMPGVLLLEAMAQAGGVLINLSAEENLSGKVYLFSGMERVRFRRPVTPGDQLHIHCFDIKNRLKIWKMTSQAEVDGELAVEATLTAAIIDKGDF